jgi:hypothetical protein
MEGLRVGEGRRDVRNDERRRRHTDTFQSVVPKYTSKNFVKSWNFVYGSKVSVSYSKWIFKNT